MAEKQEVHVQIGEGVVTLRREGQSRKRVVANILGTEKDDKDDKGEVRVIYLDRVVHRTHETFVGWSVNGAISSILTKAA